MAQKHQRFNGSGYTQTGLFHGISEGKLGESAFVMLYLDGYFINKFAHLTAPPPTTFWSWRWIDSCDKKTTCANTYNAAKNKVSGNEWNRTPFLCLCWTGPDPVAALCGTASCFLPKSVWHKGNSANLPSADPSRLLHHITWQKPRKGINECLEFPIFSHRMT